MATATFTPADPTQVTIRPRIYKVDLGKVGYQGPTGPQGNAGTSTAPSYAYASLPSASPAGQIARVTDNARGLWMSDGTTWNKVTNTVDLWDWAEPSDSVDQTSEVQDWIDAVYTYRLPGFGSGTYLTAGGIGYYLWAD